MEYFFQFTAPSLIDWCHIGALHPTRSGRECQRRAKQICPLIRFAAPTSELRLAVEVGISTVKEGRDGPIACFSPNEDLQLLMAIQKFGTGGGKLGYGTGLGLGSWNLVATALPGRTGQDCSQRYLELCDHFLPWSYVEDRQLFKLLLIYMSQRQHISGPQLDGDSDAGHHSSCQHILAHISRSELNALLACLNCDTPDQANTMRHIAKVSNSIKPQQCSNR
ncbi:unnamed protein product [Protopolystoma xenopodis]|uniref:Myb-like domain-containing protein n=1 Tax=Protopolystoma xenopodis TaxID=117903 RepID=A0A3S5FDZ5_9PLAT|nr:unnamed protein product [Protopolystoma xenopodis]